MSPWMLDSLILVYLIDIWCVFRVKNSTSGRSELPVTVTPILT